MSRAGKKTGAAVAAAPRGVSAKVKKKGIKASSRAWIERQLNDPYVRRAQQEGYRSRAVYKLMEIDSRFGILKKGMRVIDLGAAPGGWSQLAAATVTPSISRSPGQAAQAGEGANAARVVAVDYLAMDDIPGVAFLKMDFLDDAAPDRLIEALGGKPDLVMSDMAAPTTGHRRTDHLRTMALCEAAAEFAVETLNQGGHFLTKTFQGGTEGELLSMLKREFTSVHHVKPPASRGGSVELYLLARGFRGRGAKNDDDE